MDVLYINLSSECWVVPNSKSTKDFIYFSLTASTLTLSVTLDMFLLYAVSVTECTGSFLELFPVKKLDHYLMYSSEGT